MPEKENNSNQVQQENRQFMASELALVWNVVGISLNENQNAELKKNEVIFNGFATDSRKPQDKALFFALQGETHDAHLFVEQAFQKGARGFVVNRVEPSWKTWASNSIFFVVPDTLIALQKLARHERNKIQGAVVGITGSNGKTTTKEFLAAILRPHLTVHFSKGSFNNHFGLPFTLLSAPMQTTRKSVVICEMGMNHAGEIAQLCAISDPTHVVCTMVGSAHIEYLGSQEGIARAKEEIYLHSRPSAVRVYNLDNSFTEKMVHQANPKSDRVIRFSSQKSGAELHLRLVSQNVDSIEVEGQIGGVPGRKVIPVFGAQNLVNLQAAAGVALGLGLSPFEIWSSLTECKTIWGRNQKIETQNGATILFDGYNSNPESMNALIENFKALNWQTPSVGIFADMLELGLDSAKIHEQVGECVGQSGLEAVYFYGAQAKHFAAGMRRAQFSKTLVVSDTYDESLAQKICSVLQLKSLLLIKGSRGMKMERILELTELKPLAQNKVPQPSDLSHVQSHTKNFNTSLHKKEN